MNEADVPNINLDIVDPKIDVRYINGNLTGKFRFKFKQHIFNWIIATAVSGCGVHGVYLHFHEQDLEKDLANQISLTSDAQARAAVAVNSLQQLQLLLMQKPMTTPTSAIDIQGSAKPKQ